MSMTAQLSGPRVTIAIDQTEIDSLLEKEWLLTNARGSYASGTVIGCNTRRYHGLLVAALKPPVGRMVTLSNLLEKISRGEKSYELANFEFSDRLHPQGYKYLKSFRRGLGAHFLYQLDELSVEKGVYLDPEQDLVVITYDLSGSGQEITFSLTPLVAMRDFHALQTSSASVTVEQEKGVVTTRSLDPSGPAVHMYCQEASFKRGCDWWFALRYRKEAERGQDDYEDVWVPGAFETKLTPPGRITLAVQATAALERPGPLDVEAEEIIAKIGSHQQQVIETAQAEEGNEAALALAADQFVVRRRINEERESASILAGYHWFADWGRDTFIALPGVLLATGRYEEAAEVLETFAAALDGGMIPNRFDDYGGEPHYNSVDASLWFINAGFAYMRITNDRDGFEKRFRPVILEIVKAYEEGTRFDIHTDTDGLITGGNSETQLTWMDARCNGVSFTPRYGKAVEVNALWFNALCICSETASTRHERQHFIQKAQKVQDSFIKLFWNDAGRCLCDCVFPDGTCDRAIRPNQILAVSLPFSALAPQQQLAVVKCVEEHLLTPYGLRSLSPTDSRYQGHYRGDRFQRDSSYHQGMVWGWLIGPFVEAYLKAHSFSPDAQQRGAELIEPLLRHIYSDACLGNISEIFDGDYPHRPGGCIAQAWSAAELLRVRKLLR